MIIHSGGHTSSCSISISDVTDDVSIAFPTLLEGVRSTSNSSPNETLFCYRLANLSLTILFIFTFE